MRNYIPSGIYLYDYGRLLANVAVTAAIVFIVYSVLFGSIW
jgi:hypothetical protein